MDGLFKTIFYSVIITALMINFSPIAFADIDKWGGDDSIRNPKSKFQEGTITNIGEWMLSDSTKNWSLNELSGCILQPDVNEEIYFLIKSNTSNQLTIYGSLSEANEERSFRTLDQHGYKNGYYAILDQWSVNKVNGRWLLFNPYGNSFFIKSVNGFNYENHRYGTDIDGRSLLDNLMVKNDTSDKYDAIIAEIDTLKKQGFNCLGEIVDVYRSIPGNYNGFKELTTARFLPFMAQVRISYLELKNTESFEVNGGKVWDAADASFKNDIEKQLISEKGAKTEGISSFKRTFWNPKFLTPYYNVKYNIAANPWYIGLDWDEEPSYLRSEHTNEHMGYWILVSNGSTPRKKRAIKYLQNKYGNISNLNVTWGSSFNKWSDLQGSRNSEINPLLSSEPKCRDYGIYKEKNENMKKDLDDIAADFWRIYCKKVHNALDQLIGVHKINFGPGYHGWIGSADERDNWDGLMSPHYLHRGAVSEDGSEVYVDVIGIGDPMHGPHQNADNIFEHMREDMQSIYAQVGRPFWHESCWITAEADSGVTHTGKVDDLNNITITSEGTNFNTKMNWNSTYHGVSSRIWLMFDPELFNQKDWIWYAIKSDGAGENTLTVDIELGPGNGWNWDKTPDLTKTGNIGSKYVIIAHDVIPHIGATEKFNLYIPLTQEERAEFYVKFLDEMIDLKGPNGDFIDVGYSHWEFFDYAFRDGFHEHRNWGFATVKGNLYNGIDAVKANNETQNCGNFVGPVSRKLKNIYNDIISYSSGYNNNSNITAPKNLRIQ